MILALMLSFGKYLEIRKNEKAFDQDDFMMIVFISLFSWIGVILFILVIWYMVLAALREEGK